MARFAGARARSSSCRSFAVLPCKSKSLARRPERSSSNACCSRSRCSRRRRLPPKSPPNRPPARPPRKPPIGPASPPSTPPRPPMPPNALPSCALAASATIFETAPENASTMVSAKASKSTSPLSIMSFRAAPTVSIPSVIASDHEPAPGPASAYFWPIWSIAAACSAAVMTPAARASSASAVAFCMSRMAATAGSRVAIRSSNSPRRSRAAPAAPPPPPPPPIESAKASTSTR